MTAPATTSLGTLLPFSRTGSVVAGRELVEGDPERLDLLVGEDALARPLGAEALQARRRVALDQLLAEAPPERRADQGEDPVGADGGPAGDPFQEGAQLAASDLLGGLGADRRAKHGRLEGPPVVAVRGCAPPAFARVDVGPHEAGHAEGLDSHYG